MRLPKKRKLCYQTFQTPLRHIGIRRIDVFIEAWQLARVATHERQRAISHNSFRIYQVLQHLFNRPFAIGISKIRLFGRQLLKKTRQSPKVIPKNLKGIAMWHEVDVFLKINGVLAGVRALYHRWW